MVRIVFQFNSYIFSDIFPLFNMLATAITSEPSRKLQNEYGTERITKQRCVEKQQSQIPFQVKK